MNKLIMTIGIVCAAYVLQAQEAPKKGSQDTSTHPTKRTPVQTDKTRQSPQQNTPRKNPKEKVKPDNQKHPDNQQDTTLYPQKKYPEDRNRNNNKPGQQPKLGGEGKNVPDTMSSDQPYISNPDTLDPKHPE
jgi:hypothetical protein